MRNKAGGDTAHRPRQDAVEEGRDHLDVDQAPHPLTLTCRPVGPVEGFAVFPRAQSEDIWQGEYAPGPGPAGFVVV